MKRILFLITIFTLFSSWSFAQVPPVLQGYIVNYTASQYNYGNPGGGPPLHIYTGSSVPGGGSGTLILTTGYTTTVPGGKRIVPISGPTLPKIAIGMGSANYEVVTVTASSCPTPDQPGTCTFTATFTNPHGAGEIVASGDGGIQEAINDASLNGGGQVLWVIDSGPLTLSTSLQDTPIGTISIPVNSVVEGATARVLTTITTGCTGWSLAKTGGTVDFSANNTTLTAGTTTDTVPTVLTQPTVVTAAVIPIVHCAGAAAGAGVVHARLWGYKLAAPAN